MLCKKQLELCIVTKNDTLGESCEILEKLIIDGATMVQLCQDDLVYCDFLSLAKEVKCVCHKHRVPLIIKGNIQAVLESEADGIYIHDMNHFSEIRNELGDDKIIGTEADNVPSIMTAMLYGADYISISSNENSLGDFLIDKLDFLYSVSPLPIVLEFDNNRKLSKKIDKSKIDGITLDLRFMDYRKSQNVIKEVLENG